MIKYSTKKVIEYEDKYMNNTIPEVINGSVMGVKFDVWLARDINETVGGYTELFWDRNFYPNIQAVANDLHKRGLIEAGQYTIKIDW